LGHPERLITYLKRQVGEATGAFLLAGYGDEGPVTRRSFVVRTSPQSEPVEWHLEQVIDGNSTTLPCGDDPLVIAALLKLLFDRKETRIATFLQRDLLKLLDWKDSVVTRRAMERAILRYFNTSYIGKKMSPGRGRQMGVERITVTRLITRYETDRVYVEAKGIWRTYVMVDFDTKVIEQLRQGRLFDINWNLITSFTPSR
jgi:hypothetical protein